MMMLEAPSPTVIKRNWLALSRAPQPHARLYALIEKNPDIRILFTTKQPGLSKQQQAYLQDPPWSFIDDSLALITQNHWHVITIDSATYPDLLKHIPNPPLVLFAKGNIDLLSAHQIAMVGSRRPSVDGREQAYRFAKALGDHGLVITSGLAYGIDAASHQGALDSLYPHTIAVMATGLDRVYPTQHQALSERILAQDGLLLTEFLPKTRPYAYHFPQRNRIISGLSHGVFVVEAAMKSGSLITAKFALEQNRDVFAMPGAIGNPMAKGCHLLLREGAQLVENTDDILQSFTHLLPCMAQSDTIAGAHLAQKKSASLSKDEMALLAHIGYQGAPADQIIARSALPASQVAMLLTQLTLTGHIALSESGYHLTSSAKHQ